MSVSEVLDSVGVVGEELLAELDLELLGLDLVVVDLVDVGLLVEDFEVAEVVGAAHGWKTRRKLFGTPISSSCSRHTSDEGSARNDHSSFRHVNSARSPSSMLTSKKRPSQSRTVASLSTRSRTYSAEHRSDTPGTALLVGVGELDGVRLVDVAELVVLLVVGVAVLLPEPSPTATNQAISPATSANAISAATIIHGVVLPPRP